MIMLDTIPFASVAHSSRGPTVIALKGSEGSGQQWRGLAKSLGDRFTLIAPDCIGCGADGDWHGERPFQLADEARSVVEIIDELEEPVHLVGHSYGGGVALRVAVERPHLITSLSLYEPAAFHVLKAIGADGRRLLREIQAVASEIDRNVMVGAYRSAAKRLVDYWSDETSYASRNSDAQADLARNIRKASLEFRALIEERTPLVAYSRFRVPLLLMCGERVSEAVELITRKLASTMNPGALRFVTGSGRVGPFSRPTIAAQVTADHIVAAELKTNRKIAA
jgi:pimeloyl-ACP methyl ester carboxylesterase